MVNWVDTIKAMEGYKKYVITAARRNLKKSKIGGNSKLYKSLRAIVGVRQARSLKGRFKSGKQPQMTFTMNDYGHFVDKGVKGTKDKDANASSKPYAFKKSKKSIPWDVVDGFLSSRARSRGKGGRFKKTNRNTLLYLIGKAIHEKGIKRSLFLTKPLEKGKRKMVNNVAKGAANDITREFVRQLKVYFKDNKTIK